MAKTTSSAPNDKIELYEKLVATNPHAVRKGAAMPYTSRNGHMFSFLTNTGKLALRLPDAEREAFLKKHKASLCTQHGTVMKEYVEVPDALLKKTAELVKYFDISYAYVGSLKPKPTTKKPTTKKPTTKKKPSK